MISAVSVAATAAHVAATASLTAAWSMMSAVSVVVHVQALSQVLMVQTPHAGEMTQATTTPAIIQLLRLSITQTVNSNAKTILTAKPLSGMAILFAVNYGTAILMQLSRLRVMNALLLSEAHSQVLVVQTQHAGEITQTTTTPAIIQLLRLPPTRTVNSNAMRIATAKPLSGMAILFAVNYGTAILMQLSRLRVMNALLWTEKFVLWSCRGVTMEVPLICKSAMANVTLTVNVPLVCIVSNATTGNRFQAVLAVELATTGTTAMTHLVLIVIPNCRGVTLEVPPICKPAMANVTLTVNVPLVCIVSNAATGNRFQAVLAVELATTGTTAMTHPVKMKP